MYYCLTTHVIQEELFCQRFYSRFPQILMKNFLFISQAVLGQRIGDQIDWGQRKKSEMFYTGWTVYMS